MNVEREKKNQFNNITKKSLLEFIKISILP